MVEKVEVIVKRRSIEDPVVVIVVENKGQVDNEDIFINMDHHLEIVVIVAIVHDINTKGEDTIIVRMDQDRRRRDLVEERGRLGT